MDHSPTSGIESQGREDSRIRTGENGWTGRWLSFSLKAGRKEGDRRIPCGLGSFGSIGVFTRIVKEGVWRSLIGFEVERLAGILSGLLQERHVLVGDRGIGP